MARALILTSLIDTFGREAARSASLLSASSHVLATSSRTTTAATTTSMAAMALTFSATHCKPMPLTMRLPSRRFAADAWETASFAKSIGRRWKPATNVPFEAPRRAASKRACPDTSTPASSSSTLRPEHGALSYSLREAARPPLAGDFLPLDGRQPRVAECRLR